MFRKKSLVSVVAFAFAAAFAVAAPVWAQEGGWGSDVEDFSATRPAQLKAEADGGDTDFSAALEAAAAAEGRTTASTESAPASEFVPKNEITVTKNPDAADDAGQKEGKKKKEKKPKAEGSGERLGHTMGARLGVGRDIDFSLGIGVGLSDVNRLGFGINMGWGVSGEYSFSTYEGFGFFDWNINLSDDGALRWFVGPGITFGFYGAESEKEKWKDWVKTLLPAVKDTTGMSLADLYDEISAKIKNKEGVKMNYAPSFGVGARTGLEVDLSFIDPDHPLSMLRSSSVSLDVRLVLYLFDNANPENYPVIMPTLGITYNYVFGSGKGKEKEKK